MKTVAERRPLTLFSGRESSPAPRDFESRLREFARVAAGRARARGLPADCDRFVTALHGYHRAWSISSRTAVPALDERAVRLAVSVYAAAAGFVKNPAA